MPINADKPHLWKADTRASVDQFNQWFMQFAPAAYRETRRKTVSEVAHALMLTNDLASISPEIIKSHPGIVQVLRMSTCPPLARDRLVGLADTSKSLVETLESAKIPPRISQDSLEEHLEKITRILSNMLDVDIFPWLEGNRAPSRQERYRSSTIIADRLCGAVADPIVRNAQEKRQLAIVAQYLTAKGYKLKAHPAKVQLVQMEPGTFSFRLNVFVKSPDIETIGTKIPVDAVIQPLNAKLPHLPFLIEAKSAGDFTNVNKRRKEEATKIHQLKNTFGEKVVFVLFLCGYFDAAYLGYEAAEGIDWIWEHRLEDIDQLGI